MNKASPQDLSVLSSAKQGLVYLTANDWVLMTDKATHMTFKTGDNLVQKGRRTHGLYLLLKGMAEVQLASQGAPTLGPGEVCGEISFIDDLPATADVIAKTPVEAYYIDRPTLQSLFELFPHLGSRFYRSMASSLSRRMRELIAGAAAKK